jgi:hypothetical protein
MCTQPVNGSRLRSIVKRCSELLLSSQLRLIWPLETAVAVREYGADKMAACEVEFQKARDNRNGTARNIRLGLMKASPRF